MSRKKKQTLPLTDQEIETFKRLETIRKLRGIKVEQAASWLRMNKGSYSRKLKSKQIFSVRELLELNRRFHIPWEELFGEVRYDPELLELINVYLTLRNEARSIISGLIKGFADAYPVRQGINQRTYAIGPANAEGETRGFIEGRSDNSEYNPDKDPGEEK